MKKISGLTPAGLRGIGVTLKPKGGGAKWPYKKHRLYELAQMFSIFDFFHIAHSIRKTMAQKLGLYLL